MDSHRPAILEVIACTMEDAVAAERGGATRLEIISRYDLGGLTPRLDLVREIVRAVRIPVRVMLREEENFRIAEAEDSEKKMESLCEAARSFRELPIDGFVLGFLRGNQIDHELVARVLACAPELKATFHRAFEEVADPAAAIAELKRHAQIDCILTSGGGDPRVADLAQFDAWEKAARPEMGMLVGGGTDAETIRRFLASTAIRAFHLGRAVRDEGRWDGAVHTELVKNFAGLAQQ